MKIRQCFHSVTSGIAMMAIATVIACARERPSQDDFVRSLRCGMSRTDVSTVARKHGYNQSDKTWMKRSESRAASQTRRLTLVDLTFRNGSLVAVREGTYDPRTRQTTWSTIDLCR